jgi:hypothetical protein
MMRGALIAAGGSTGRYLGGRRREAQDVGRKRWGSTFKFSKFTCYFSAKIF